MQKLTQIEEAILFMDFLKDLGFDSHNLTVDELIIIKCDVLRAIETKGLKRN